MFATLIRQSKSKLTSTSLKTLSVHGGESICPTTKASVPPLVLSTTFAVEEPLSFSANELDADSPWCYTRWANPTVRSLEEKISLMENAPNKQNTVTFGSGMAASAATMFSFLKSGDHVVAADVNYPGVAELFRHSLPKFGVEVTTIDPSDLSNVQAAIRPDTKMVWIETPCNPILRLTDIQGCADIAHSVGAELVVDSTFATPCITKPLDLGADFVIHSLSKYLNGHGDAIGGCVVGKVNSRIQELRAEGAIHHGGVLPPFNAYLIARGMATLPLRMAQHSSTATILTEWLSKQDIVDKVFYPHSPDHPQYELGMKQMKMGGGMVSFVVKDGVAGAEKMAKKMMKELDIIHYAVSLGHQRSLIYLLSTKDLAERDGSSYALSGEALNNYKKFTGEGGVFRFSVGLEEPEDLIKDLQKVFYS